MTILGYNTLDKSGFAGFGSGRLYASKFTLASTYRLTELHGWVSGGVNPTSCRVVMYADAAGSPGVRVAYTALLAIPSSADSEISQAGFNIVLPAGDYWLGFASPLSDPGQMWAGLTGGTLKGSLTAPDPPPDPFGSISVTGDVRKLCAWAVADSVVYAYSAYSHSGDTIARTFNAYSFTGDTKADRYKGASPSDVAKKAWVYPSYTGGSGGGVSGGGGISIFTKP
jgi:hypothetical protein